MQYPGSIVGETLVNPPHIYSLSTHNDQLALALGSGHILFSSLSSLSEPSLSALEAHLTRVVQVSWPHFSPGDLLVSVGNEPNLALWRQGELVKRVQLPDKVNWMESDSVRPKIYLAGVGNDIISLSFPG